MLLIIRPIMGRRCSGANKRKDSMTNAEMQQEALDRAQSGQALTNYPAIFAGFMAKGIPEGEIKPRENV